MVEQDGSPIVSDISVAGFPFLVVVTLKLTTDGHGMYLQAVEGAFGNEVDFAMLVKLYGNAFRGSSRIKCQRFTSDFLTRRRDVYKRQGHNGYLWASGFIPRLRTYPGWESPVPLTITIQHGDADITQVARDILCLTKLNYNACKYGESEPVTIGFSNAVGEILVSNPTIKNRSPKFKFYI